MSIFPTFVTGASRDSTHTYNKEKRFKREKPRSHNTRTHGGSCGNQKNCCLKEHFCLSCQLPVCVVVIVRRWGSALHSATILRPSIHSIHFLFAPNIHEYMPMSCASESWRCSPTCTALVYLSQTSASSQIENNLSDVKM